MPHQSLADDHRQGARSSGNSRWKRPSRSILHSREAAGRHRDRRSPGPGMSRPDGMESLMSVEMSLRLPAEPTAAASARHSLKNRFDRVLENTLLESVELLASELVTNSLRHGRLGRSDFIEIWVRASEEKVRVEVTDPGPGFRPVRRPSPLFDHSGGWGLYLVDQIASRWGVLGKGSTKVWLEIDRKPGSTNPRNPRPS